MPPHEQPSTSGLAVAAFVLSLVWLGGLGSILAIVLAIVLAISALGAIRASRGTKGGGGLAIAGLVIGILGVLGAVAFYVSIALLGHALKVATTPTVVPAGTTLNVSAADTSGIRSVTVTSIKYPVDDSSGQTDATPGKEYAAVNLRVCAGPTGAPNGVDMLLFSVLSPGGAEGGPVPATSTYPSFDSSQALAPNRCLTGYQTFEINRGTIPIQVRYWPDPIDDIRWNLKGYTGPP